MSELSGYNGVRVLIIGASGFIGRWVSHLLSENNSDLILIGKDLDRLLSVMKKFRMNGKGVAIDLEKPGTFKNLYNDVKPDITFNLIGYGVSQKERDEDLMWKINSSLPGEITQTISEDKKSSHQMIRLIHVGSGFEYGTIENEITESTIPNPKTIYGKSKLAGTKKVCEISCKTGLPALTARLFTVYGPGEEEPRLFPSLVRISKTQESLNLTGGEQERDFTFVKDAAMGLLKLGILKNVPGPIINVATGTLLKVKDFALCAANLMGIPEDRLCFGAIPYREDEVLQGRVSTKLLRESTNWSPSKSIHQGLKESIEFQRSQ